VRNPVLDQVITIHLDLVLLNFRPKSTLVCTQILTSFCRPVADTDNNNKWRYTYYNCGFVVYGDTQESWRQCIVVHSLEYGGDSLRFGHFSRHSLYAHRLRQFRNFPFMSCCRGSGSLRSCTLKWRRKWTRPGSEYPVTFSANQIHNATRWSRVCKIICKTNASIVGW